jgi:S1-C subfamily serine protease
LAAPDASAQAIERSDDVRVRVEISDSIDNLVFDFVTLRRARLGVNVNLQASESDEYGALINSVSPNGPAGRAGVKSGDIIVKLDGKSLLDDSHLVLVEDGSSAPGLRLIALTAELQPDDTIDIQLRRDDTTLQLTIVPDAWPTLVEEWRTPGGDWGVAFGRDSILVEMERGYPRVRTRVMRPDVNSFFFRGSLFDLELAPINRDLGSYFGTNEGVLVISTPANSGLNLKGGDVVLAVDGRPATDPMQLHRILRSYQPEESFQLSIMRDQRRMTVTGELTLHQR